MRRNPLLTLMHKIDFDKNFVMCKMRDDASNVVRRREASQRKYHVDSLLMGFSHQELEARISHGVSSEDVSCALADLQDIDSTSRSFSKSKVGNDYDLIPKYGILQLSDYLLWARPAKRLNDLECVQHETQYHDQASPSVSMTSWHQQFQDEVEKLEKIGVLREVKRSRWTMPRLPQLQHDNTIQSSQKDVHNAIRCNKQQKLQLLPTICTLSPKSHLKSATFVTTMDFNVAYDHISSIHNTLGTNLNLYELILMILQSR